MKILDYYKVLTRAKPIKSDVRSYFEKVVIQALGIFHTDKVLFVGVGPYTYHYPALFNDAGVELWTVDYRPEAGIWGAKNRHFTADITNISGDLEKHKFKLIILMGVIGYGLNDRDIVVSAFKSLSGLLEHNGYLLVACEDEFGIDPVELVASNGLSLEHSSCHCFLPSVRMPVEDYGFHFFRKK